MRKWLKELKKASPGRQQHFHFVFIWINGKNFIASYKMACVWPSVSQRKKIKKAGERRTMKFWEMAFNG